MTRAIHGRSSYRPHDRASILDLDWLEERMSRRTENHTSYRESTPAVAVTFTSKKERFPLGFLITPRRSCSSGADEPSARCFRLLLRGDWGNPRSPVRPILAFPSALAQQHLRRYAQAGNHGRALCAGLPGTRSEV